MLPAYPGSMVTRSRNHLFVSMLVGVVTAAALACGNNGSDVPSSSDTAENKQQPATQSEQEGTRSLDPTTFDRSCSVDSDCVLVDIVTDCDVGCCGSEPVRNTSELQAARAELARGCDTLWGCTKLCDAARAVCSNGLCAKQSADADAGADGG